MLQTCPLTKQDCELENGHKHLNARIEVVGRNPMLSVSSNQIKELDIIVRFLQIYLSSQNLFDSLRPSQHFSVMPERVFLD